MFGFRGILHAVIGISLLGAATTGHAWSVLGCPFGPNVEAFIECVNDASSNAVDVARQSYEGTIDTLQGQLDELENSPYLAGLPGEQAALLALRDMPIEQLHACLADRNLNLGVVMSGAVANPVAFTQARLGELTAASVELGGSLLGPSLQSLGQGGLPDDSPQAIAGRAQQAYDAIVRLAQEDPVAACALPMITPLAPQIRQAALMTYDHAISTAEQLMAQTVQPVLDQALMASLAIMLNEMRIQSAPPQRQYGGRQAATSERPSRTSTAERGRREAVPAAKEPTGRRPDVKERASPSGRSGIEAPPARGERQSAKAPMRTSATTRRGSDVGKPVLRTRSIRGAAQGVVNSAVPDDVQRIALAVFTERMLDPRRLDSLTREIHDLSAALGDGSARNFDFTDFDKLIEELSTPSDQIAAEIGLEVARFYGHYVLEKAGRKIVDMGIGSASAANAISQNVGHVICAIGHIPSEAGCSVVIGIASFLYLQFGVPVISAGIMATSHVAWEQTVNCAAQAVRAGYSTAGISTAACGRLGPLAQQFPTGEELAAFALQQIDASRSSLFEYQQAVHQLARASQAGAAGERR